MTKTKTNRPLPPEDLHDEALLEWHRICDELDAAGRLDKADRAVIAAYVKTWANNCAATRGVNAHGPIIKYPNGVVAESPFCKLQMSTAKLMLNYLTALGLTPAARGKGADASAATGDLDF